VAGAAAFLLGLAVDSPLLRLAAKPVPVVCLAVWVGAYGRSVSSRAVCAGLLLSALGDALLEASPRLFLAGLLAFLAAHVAYTAGFVRESRRWCIARGLPFALWGVVGYLAMRGGLAELRAPVIVYLTAICVMMWRAAALPGHEGPVRRFEWLALAGAVLFGMSDTLIGLDRFRAPISGARVPIIVLYWLGQVGIAASTVLRPGTGTGYARR
jgi:alkenylglycerophosphocholine/alkenylglycerophosphoethanolamine hydrolase